MTQMFYITCHNTWPFLEFTHSRINLVQTSRNRDRPDWPSEKSHQLFCFMKIRYKLPSKIFNEYKSFIEINYRFIILRTSTFLTQFRVPNQFRTYFDIRKRCLFSSKFKRGCKAWDANVNFDTTLQKNQNRCVYLRTRYRSYTSSAWRN